jgi:hypothetical protein
MESASVRTVVIRVLGDEAEVYRNGAPVGKTPYTLRAPLGTELSLTLRRPGYEDEPVVLRVAEGMSEFIQSMKPLRRP